jgi:hypothetical protein
MQLGAKGLAGCKLGTTNNGDQLWRWRKEFEGEKYCVNPVHQLCLSLNMTGGAQIRELHHIPLLFLSLPLGPTRQEPIFLPCCVHLPSAGSIFPQQNSTKNGKRVKRRRKFTNFMPLESSRRGECDRIIFI